MKSIKQPDEWERPLTNWFNKLDQDILSGRIASETHTQPSDSLELERCLICRKYILNPKYQPYSVCSSKCDLQASVDEDRGQDGN